MTAASRISVAPLKKTFELAPSGKPENSSMLYGPAGFTAAMPSSSACTSLPTSELS